MRKILAVVVMSALLVSVFSVATRTEEPSPLDGMGNMAAHRGGAGIYPENTLTAFKAIQADMPGVVLEMDVMGLKDGTLVISHDKTVNRVSDSTGNVKDMTRAQWSALMINHPQGGPSAPASTLKQVLDVYAGTPIPMFIELKDYSVADAFIEALFPYRNQIVVAAFNATVAERLLKSGFQTMQLSTTPPTLIEGVQYVGISNINITKNFVNKAHQAGTKVWAWGNDVTADVADTDTRGIDGFIADNPEGVSLS